MPSWISADIFGLNEETISRILEKLCEIMNEFDRIFMVPYDLKFSNKNLSEIISKIIEITAAKILTQELGFKVDNASSDREPDLFFHGIKMPLEVKVTSTNSTWMGGEFSKRPANYMLVSWDPESKFSRFFVAYTHLTNDDWESSMQKGKRFYAPKFTAKKLFEKPDRTVLIGSFEKTPRGAVKLSRHSIRTLQTTLEVEA